jgi:hypothetical protein
LISTVAAGCDIEFRRVTSRRVFARRELDVFDMCEDPAREFSTAYKAETAAHIEPRKLTFIHLCLVASGKRVVQNVLQMPRPQRRHYVEQRTQPAVISS